MEEIIIVMSVMVHTDIIILDAATKELVQEEDLEEVILEKCAFSLFCFLESL